MNFSKLTRPYGVVAVAAALVLGALASPAAGQGLLVDTRAPIRLPRPIWPPQPEPAPASYKIESIEVGAKISGSIARVRVSQTFVNTGSQQLEATFVFPLPYDGAIDQLTLLVDGKEYAAKLLGKEEARKRYEEIVRTNRDPALLEWAGTGMFQTSVFPIPPGAKRTVTLRYTQICRTSHGLADFLFPLSTAKYTDAALEKLSVSVSIESESSIKNVYSPTHEVEVKRPDKRHAVVSFQAENTIPSEDFRLFFAAGNKGIGASVVSYRPDTDEPGYFLLLASPELKQSDDDQQAKTVLLVVDRSGSMSGEKMEQAKGAARFVLNNLRKGDTFNIVAYDSEIETFRPELEKFDDKSRGAALGFINGLYAGGSTNIDGALKRALGMLNDEDRPTYVIFLTDGLPTVGETKEPAIAAHAAEANDVRARLFAFGVGYDVNARLLDKLARENHGQSEYVRPEEDIEDAVSKLYRRIGAPVLTDVRLSVDVEDAEPSAGSTVDRLYPRGRFDLFAGDQAVIVGRYRTPGDAKVTLAGKLGGEKKSFSFPAELVAESDDDTNAFVAKLWATRRVGEIVDELDLKGKNDELVKELVELATTHGILTPYTSFLADESESAGVAGSPATIERLGRELSRLEDVSGISAVRLRESKGAMQLAARPASDGYSAAAAPAEGPEAAEAFQRYAATGGRGVTYYDAVRDKSVVAKDLIAVGRKTFLRRGERWVDASLTEEQIKAAKPIERYSREYFDLVARHGKHVAPYLAIEGPVALELDGVAYTW